MSTEYALIYNIQLAHAPSRGGGGSDDVIRVGSRAEV